MNEEIKIFDNYLNSLISYPFNRTDKAYIINYITNLQKENEKLKERNKILANDITKDRINCDVIQTVCGIPIEEIPYLKDYKQRNEKAIEYNYKLQEKTSHQALFDEPLASEIYSIAENNINILQGGNE